MNNTDLLSFIKYFSLLMSVLIILYLAGKIIPKKILIKTKLNGRIKFIERQYVDHKCQIVFFSIDEQKFLLIKSHDKIALEKL